VVDLVCARLIGMQSRKVTTLRLAEQQGLVTREMHDYVQSLEIDHLIRQFAPAKAGTVASFVHNPKRQAFFLKIRQTRVFSYLAKTRWFGRLLFLTGLRQDIFNKADLRLEAMHLLTDKCKDCGFCAKYCPLGLDPCKAILEQQEDCIQCLYCYMVCPYQAIALEGNLGFISDQLKQYDTYVRQFYASYCSQDKGACA
jgi:NAD-dependent dihydropyrimidine dehydrogenase PreA subunit